MLHYILRLDDACPFTHKENWFQVETILEKYNIQPIVGIIPDSKDKTFTWDEDKKFWTTTVTRYVQKNWVIAQHGCHHLISKGTHSEFIGLLYEKQKELIDKGNYILKEHGVVPTCFLHRHITLMILLLMFAVIAVFFDSFQMVKHYIRINIEECHFYLLYLIRQESFHLVEFSHSYFIPIQ
jgi:hypothetical protein